MIKTLIVLFFLSYETNLVFAQNETKIVEGCEVCQMVRAGKDFGIYNSNLSYLSLNSLKKRFDFKSFLLFSNIFKIKFFANYN